MAQDNSQSKFTQLRNIIIKALIFGFFLVFLTLHFADPIRLITADLGRHIKNGELILAGESKVFTSNYYSYTAPDYPFVNHHWASGVLFYWIYKWGGFPGLSFFYIGLLLAGFAVYFFLAKNLSSFSFAFFFSVLALPLMCDRLEIRPEGITTLLTGLYLYLLVLHKNGKIPFKFVVWAIPFLQIIWVNTHILFFIGGFLVFAFFLDAWLGQRDSRMTRRMLIIVGLTAAVSLINLAGLKGALVPLTIFKEYGYRLAENQTVFFMQKRFGHDPKYTHYEVMAVISVIAVGWALWRRQWRTKMGEILVLLFFIALGLKTVRSMASFAFVFIPLVSMWSYEAAGVYLKERRRAVGIVLLSAAVTAVLHGVVFAKSYFSPSLRLEPFVRMNGGQPEDVNFFYLIGHPKVWSGLVPGVNGSADFFKGTGIEGPMFNNYDIGGYLIFHLFPQAKVFVDNRPEVYSVPFFKEDYVPMQENDEAWRRMDGQYHFNVIYFSRHDLTPWGQNFMLTRVDDPEWAPVFVDDFTIIFLRRNAKNRRIIETFELPRSMFGVTR